MREGFKQALLEMGSDERFLVLSGDHGYALFDDFRRLHPEKFINVGIAESNLVNMAAGLARGGFSPLIYGLASFLPGRVYEFLKLQIALDNLPVTVVGDGGGFVYSKLGHSHQSLDDLALMGLLPNFSVFSPASDAETKSILLSNAHRGSPKYLRLGKADGSFQLGFPSKQLEPYCWKKAENTRVAVLAHGSMVSTLHDLLADDFFQEFDFWSWPHISPTSEEFASQLRNYSDVIVVEEHHKLGSLFAQLKAIELLEGVRVHSIASKPQFHRGIGDYAWTLEQHELDQKTVGEKILSISKRLAP
jgi:transketolase